MRRLQYQGETSWYGDYSRVVAPRRWKLATLMKGEHYPANIWTREDGDVMGKQSEKAIHPLQSGRCGRGLDDGSH